MSKPAGLLVKSELERPSRRAVDGLQGVATSVLADASHAVRAYGDPLKSWSAVSHFAGPALPVAAGSLAQWKALEIAEPGDVLVISCGARREQAEFGGVYVVIAEAKGVAAIVTDGLLRDVDDIRERRIPVFACGAHPSSPADPEAGTVGLPIRFAGGVLAAGDMVVGDRDGLAVLPRAELEAILSQLPRQLQKEEALKAAGSGELPPRLLNALSGVPTSHAP